MAGTTAMKAEGGAKTSSDQPISKKKKKETPNEEGFFVAKRTLKEEKTTMQAIKSWYEKQDERGWVKLSKEDKEELKDLYKTDAEKINGLEEVFSVLTYIRVHGETPEGKKMTIGEFIGKVFKEIPVDLRDIDPDVAYDMGCLAGVLASFISFRGWSGIPSEITARFKDAVKNIKNGANAAEEYAKLAIGIAKDLFTVGPSEILKYGSMAIDLPKIIGILKDPEAGWFEFRFAYFEGAYGR